MKPEIFVKANKIWAELSREIEEQDFNFNLEAHKEILNVFHIGEYYHFFFNIKQTCFDYFSPNVTRVLGYEVEEIDVPFFIGNIHPDDQPWFLNFESKVAEFFLNLTYEQIPKYKVSYDYRIKKKCGEYIRVLQQILTVNFDKDGRLLRTLGIHTNISHLKSPDVSGGRPSLSFIGLDGEPSFYNVEVKDLFSKSELTLTNREREVLCLIVNGKKSAEIADHLYISKHTVDTHRKNLLRKTKTETTAKLITHSIKNGLV